MANKVKHRPRQYKQMALEVAVRNPERYEGILKSFAKHEGVVLDDEGILDVYAQLYLDDAVTADKLADANLTKRFLRRWIKANCTHNNEWGYPTGYQAAFTRYLKTLSEFGFIYAQYQEPLKLSPVAKALVSGKITLSEAFAVQCMRFWRKSPYRRVLNDFNFFGFIIDSLIQLKEKGRKLSINQFNVGLFSDNGNVADFLELLENNKIGHDADKAYSLVLDKYSNLPDHAKIAKQVSAFRDYGNTVFRVLQLTGFVTVEYQGIIMLSPNENRMGLYKALKAESFSVSDEAKENHKLYFEELGSFDDKLEGIVVAHREAENHSTAGYNQKISNIIAAYGLTQETLKQSLLKVSCGDKGGKDNFWFIQDPVKFEFLLTLYAYTFWGDEYIYKPNYKCDEAGIPYSHAPGNIGDIEIYNDERYWLIEATLIRSKAQQVNNETVNLFRHIDETKEGAKYLTLVAPYVHGDTRLIFNVASIITLMQSGAMSLYSDSQSTGDFVESMESHRYFGNMRTNSRRFVLELKEKLNEITAI